MKGHNLLFLWRSPLLQSVELSSEQFHGQVTCHRKCFRFLQRMFRIWVKCHSVCPGDEGTHTHTHTLMEMRTDLTAVPHAGLGYHFLRVQVDQANSIDDHTTG